MDIVHSELNSSASKCPDGWTSLKLSNSATLKARIGWQGLTTAEYLETGDYYLVTGTEFLNGAIDWDSCFFVDFERYKQDKNIQVNINDVLVTKDGTIGKVAIVDSVDKPATLNSGVFVIRPINQSFHPNYFYHVLTSSYFKDFLNKLSAGSTINHLYQKDFVTFEYPAPKKIQEQELIADALSDADELIESLEKLIEKKRQIKQGAMQELLTGRKRLTGFSGEWKEYDFNDVLQKVSAKPYQIKTSDYLESGLFPIVDQGKNRIVGYSDNVTSVFKCPKDGVIVFGDHTCIVKFIKFDFVVGADGTQLLTAKSGQCALFHAYQLEYKGVKSTGYNRHFSILKERKFLAPPENEQIAIAELLSEVDKEIDNLELKLSKASQIKQGMMQELLTGRIHLV